MQVYKKILVTMDCSPVDETIVKHVTALALQNEAEVYLLHVIHAHTLDQERVLREAADKCLSTHRDEMQKQGIKVQIVIKTGEPEEEVLKEIKGSDYDLIAMATHGHNFLGDLLFGSVSRSLKHNIDIPLLLIGPGK